MTELDQLATVCERLGAPSGQARTMAAQLLKRTDQLVAERGWTREAALSHLLNLVVQGRAGEVPKDFTPPDSTPPPVI